MTSRFYDDLNEVINSALSDENLDGKKLILNGKDSVSFLDINNMIKQSKLRTEEFKNVHELTIRKFFKKWQLFFHGNNHILNMVRENVLFRNICWIIIIQIQSISTNMRILSKSTS